jgi:hypothetical protein
MAYKYNPFTGTLDEVGAGGGGGATPAGVSGSVQINNGAGGLGSVTDLKWDSTNTELDIPGSINLDDGTAGFITTLQTITPTADRTISLPNATGTVALVAGSSGQVLWNNAGVNAGASTLTYDGSVLTTSGKFVNSYNASSTTPGPAKWFTGTWFTSGGSATTTKPQVLIEPTGTTSTGWSTSGTGLGVNAASGFVGNLLDLQVNGTSRASVTSTGLATFGSSSTRGAAVIRGQAGSYPGFYISLGSDTYSRVGAELDNNDLPSIFFGPGGASDKDLVLLRDAANIFAQRRGTNAQTFRVYNTYTDASNYERLSTTWSSNVCYTKPENAGTGSARLYVPVTGATTVSGLPAAATAGAGARAFVTDANATTFLSTVAGGGANKVPVVSDGTNWLIG